MCDMTNNCHNCGHRSGLACTLGTKCSSSSGWTPEINKEQDPYGIDQHTPGAKLDAGKPRVALVLKGFARALWEVSKVGTYGADKYTDKGWMEVPNGPDRYEDAGMRHFLDEAMGEDVDPESNILHLAHRCWNDLARLELLLREKDKATLDSNKS